MPSTVSTANLINFRAFAVIAGGTNHNCSLVEAFGGNRVGVFEACWGDNRDLQTDPFGSADFLFIPQYASFGNPQSLDAQMGVSAGAFHTCGVRRQRNAECWGNNDAMQLGTNDTTDSFFASVGDLSHVIAVSTGSAHSCALLANGHVFCWGSNDFGQLGDGTRTDSATPREVGGIVSAVAIATSSDHNCALLATGAVVCWGRNDFGQADGTLSGDRLVATPVAGIAAGDAVGVTTGSQHSCIVNAAGSVRCWGRNNNGQLGDNTFNDSLTPVASASRVRSR